MKKALLALLTIFGVCILSAGIAGAVVINFDDLTTSGTDFIYMTNYSNSGFELAGDETNALMCPKSGNSFFYYGSANLSNRNFNGMTTLTSSSGAFDLSSIDLHAMYYLSANASINVAFFAYSGTVQVGYLEYAIAGSNWVTVTFGENFKNITSVQWAQGSSTGTAYLFDNINVTTGTAVPEPATLWLLGLGLMGLARVRRKLTK